MILSAFLAVCTVGAAVALLTAADRYLGPATALAGLALACVAALMIGPSDRAYVGDAELLGSTYAGTFLAVVAASAFALTLVTAVSGGSVGGAPAAIGALGGLGLAVTAVDAPISLAGAGIAAAAAAGASVVGWPADGEPDNRMAEARTLALLVGSLLFAALAIAHPAWTGENGPVLAIGLLGLGAALAVRSGTVPFHLPPARLGKRGATPTPALLLVWVPAGLGLLAVSWSAATFANPSDWLAMAAVAIAAGGLATILLGGLGAILHDDLAEIAVYSIIADSGFILLALASRSEAAAEPARAWLLVFVGAKTALVAWAAAMGGTFGSAGLADLHGWMRRAPLAGVALAVAVVAGVGWPGTVVFEARSTLVSLALPGPLVLVVPVAILLTTVCWGRVLAIGLMAPSGIPAGARGSWHRPAKSRATAAYDDAKIEAPGRAAGEDLPRAAFPSGPEAGGRNPSGGGRADRSIAAAGMVAVASVLALGVAAGSLGAPGPAANGIPLDVAARATSTPAPTPTPGATTPVPTLAPHTTLSPSGAAASASASASPGPTRSAAPATIPQQ